MLSFYLSLIENSELKQKFADVYEKYLDWMLTLAFYYTKNVDDAQDVVHNTFLSILSISPDFCVYDEDEIKAYLFVCLRNRSFSFIERKKRHQVVSLDEKIIIEDTASTDYDVLIKEEEQFIRSLINNLNECYRDVLFLFINYGLNSKEISELLDIPKKTIETRIYRGKKMLKKFLRSKWEI